MTTNKIKETYFSPEQLLNDYEKISQTSIPISEHEHSPDSLLNYCARNYVKDTEEIYAIIPIKKYDFKYCLIIYADSYQLVTMTAIKSINYWLADIHITYEKFCDLICGIHEELTYFSPVTNADYVLFPTSSSKNIDTIWLNPFYIKNIKNKPLGSDIYLTNHLVLTCDKHDRSIVKGLIRAINTLIFIKQSTNLIQRVRRVKGDIQLADELDIPKECYIRKDLSKINFHPDIEKTHATAEVVLEFKNELLAKIKKAT